MTLGNGKLPSLDLNEGSGAYRLKAKRRLAAQVSLGVAFIGAVGLAGASWFRARAAEAPEKTAEAHAIGAVEATVSAHDKELAEIRKRLETVDDTVSEISVSVGILLDRTDPGRGVRPIPAAVAPARRHPP